ncbi:MULTISPECIES: alpha/beta hydrolase [Levilactobacillus]|uniref:alpha/beta hydrolase n=1 Tax=Levilactobacillus TaxID=2767886 RepID=UPI001950079A|nr:alpha/beta hydrolase [Levilactobacillus sp. 244-2]
MWRKLRWLPMVLGASWLGFHWASRQTTPAEPLRRRRPRFTYTTTPTLFIPGWGGNAWTYNGLLRWLARAGFGHKVLTVRVDRHGELHVTGKWTGQADNPLIQVIFDHTFTADYQQQIGWITAILRHLKSHYHVQAYNLVAHSWGGSAAVNSLLLYGAAGDVPRLNRLVLLGAPVDEHDADHPVDATFQRLRATPVDWSALGTGMIHNVYGTLSGRLTDGSVPVSQITPLRPLLADSALGYQEHHVPGVGHGRLHSSPRMWRLIARLLWADE